MPRAFALWGLAALMLALLARTLARADAARAFELVRGLGRTAPALALPAVAVLLFETLAWQVSLAPLASARARSYARLAEVRLAAESLLMSVPGGVVLSEGLMPLLLRDRCGMPIAEATAATAARKWLGTRSHGLYILLGAVLGWGFLADRSRAMTGAPGVLPWVIAFSALLPLSLSAFMELAMSRGALAKRTWALLERVPLTSLRAWLRARGDAAVATDAELARVIDQGKPRAAAATLLYVAACLCESLEAYVIARALGAPFGFVEILAFEAGLSLVRSVVFFAPSGIGVQDLGYVALFGSTGLPGAEATGAAFVIVKRAREMVWVAAGWFFVLAYARRHAPPVRWAAEARALPRAKSSATAPQAANAAERSHVSVR